MEKKIGIAGEAIYAIGVFLIGLMVGFHFSYSMIKMDVKKIVKNEKTDTAKKMRAYFKYEKDQ